MPLTHGSFTVLIGTISVIAVTPTLTTPAAQAPALGSRLAASSTKAPSGSVAFVSRTGATTSARVITCTRPHELSPATSGLSTTRPLVLADAPTSISRSTPRKGERTRGGKGATTTAISRRKNTPIRGPPTHAATPASHAYRSSSLVAAARATIGRPTTFSRSAI